MSQTSGLTVRQHQREHISLRAEFLVCEAHREQVRYSPVSSAPQPHMTSGRAIDISSGGVGLICDQYLPRMCEGLVRIYDPRPVGKGVDGSPVYEVAFEHHAKVRRVTLETHDPTYAVGAAFIDPAPDVEGRVTEVLKLAETSVAEPEPGKEGADG